jgi:hypothetical protein
MGRSLSPSIPSAIQQHAPVADRLLHFVHNGSNGRSGHSLLSSQQYDLSAGTESHTLGSSIQLLQGFHFFFCQGWYLQRL